MFHEFLIAKIDNIGANQIDHENVNDLNMEHGLPESHYVTEVIEDLARSVFIHN